MELVNNTEDVQPEQKSIPKTLPEYFKNASNNSSSGSSYSINDILKLSKLEVYILVAPYKINTRPPTQIGISDDYIVAFCIYDRNKDVITLISSDLYKHTYNSTCEYLTFEKAIYEIVRGMECKDFIIVTRRTISDTLRRKTLNKNRILIKENYPIITAIQMQIKENNLNLKFRDINKTKNIPSIVESEWNKVKDSIRKTYN